MNNKDRAAMQQALEALEELHYSSGTVVAARMYESATAALREALDHSGEANEMVDFFSKEMKNKISVARAEQAEQEPVAWKDMAFARLGVVRDKMRPDDVAVVQRFLDGDYAAPVRTKDLTEYELDELRFQNLNYLDYARAVIAADREKNK